MSNRRAFVVGAYLPNGGTYMAYHLGCILQRDFGIPAVAVQMGSETRDNGVHAYAVDMPMLSREAMEREVAADDILIVNPSFSPHQFGWRLPGFKISYVQDFKTFQLLDRRLDHYVAVSDFVAAFLRTVYGLETAVIPPFVDLDLVASMDAPEWAARPPHRVATYRKGMPEVWDLSYRRLRELVAGRAPHIVFAEPLAAGHVPQPKLLAHLGAARYFVTLSAAEGFGLVPLEAMALGTVVVGYDAFGGRHYLRSGENSLVAPYPDIDRVAEMLIAADADPTRSASIAAQGRATATHYSYAAFREKWIGEFSRVLRQEPLAG